MKHCPECGNKIKEISKFCSSCGYELKVFHEALNTPKKKNINLKEDEEEIFECSGCGKEFKNEDVCSRHVKNCRGKEEEEETKSIFKKPREEDKEDVFECEHCGKSFVNETVCLRHEKHCPENYTKRETTHHESSHEQPKSNAGIVIIVVIIIIVIAAIILMGMFGQQQQASSFAGQTNSLIDNLFG